MTLESSLNIEVKKGKTGKDFNTFLSQVYTGNLSLLAYV